MHPAMQSDWSLTFHAVDNDALLCYSKRAGDDRVLVVVNLDPHHAQAGFVNVEMSALGLDVGVAYTVQDLLTETRYTWYGSRNFVRLDPAVAPAHVFTVS
jgi:starch synthase (maltosyl-transferring)